MKDFLWRNNSSLSRLPYDKMRFDLLEYEVITPDEKRRIEHDQVDKYRMREVLNRIRDNLYRGQTINFKRFLKLMEDSDDPVLVEMAEKLG